MCLAFSTTVNDAHCCTVRRLVPNATSRVAHPLPATPAGGHPGSLRPSPTWPLPTAPAGSGPAGSTQETTAGLSTPLSPSSGALPQPGHTEGEPRSCGTHHPALGNPPAAPRWLPKHTAESAGCQASSQPPGTPEPAQSEPPDRHPPAPQGCLGTRLQGGHRTPSPTVQTRERLRAEASRAAQPSPVRAQPSHVALP